MSPIQRIVHTFAITTGITFLAIANAHSGGGSHSGGSFKASTPALSTATVTREGNLRKQTQAKQKQQQKEATKLQNELKNTKNTDNFGQADKFISGSDAGRSDRIMDNGSSQIKRCVNC